ncbi:hypothetical protein MDAP_002780 [Mitosporidium daphniae]|uniref:HNH domain-containing protein n=1 Tax=Mitosporidium daphniae TaxID=1485682 RepID=A0A098VTK8_9MICR|nr:uncharacterized protein DI09_1p190 [Mitosporidium daphniae]KGG52169.1 hypothetical protein DI09_1p190 [Mitosporidium daphniae]|eukprot:XP_013238596.1 uncharacterized protein DI09_1p190 [Mitosporidium daphniae]
MEGRSFSRAAKRECWAAAPIVSGRSPDRWRFDACGNIVCAKLSGCEGCLCFEYDHIIPFSKGGPSVSSNCQILQTRVNRLKGSQEDLDSQRLSNYSCAKSWKLPEELDIIELAVWGDISREGRRCRTPSLLEQFQTASDAFLHRQRGLPPCE